jgi:hypothetical protein
MRNFRGDAKIGPPDKRESRPCDKAAFPKSASTTKADRDTPKAPRPAISVPPSVTEAARGSIQGAAAMSDLQSMLAQWMLYQRAETAALARCRRLMRKLEPLKVSDLAKWVQCRHGLSESASLEIARDAARHACERSRYRP